MKTNLKKTILIISVFVVTFYAASTIAEMLNPPTPPTPSPFYTNITNLWRQGHQNQVLAIANARLATNENDLVGLILKAGYDFDFADKQTLSNTLVRVLRVARHQRSQAYRSIFPLSALDMEGTIKSLEQETEDKRAADLQKVQGPGHFFPYTVELKALDMDGLLQ